MSSVKWIVIKESLDDDINNAAASNIRIEVEENAASDNHIEENAAPIIQVEENVASNIRIEVKEDATNLLYTKAESVNLISIFGPARTGKSTLMNILAGVNDYDNEIFKTSPDMETVTTGVDISKTFVPLKEFSKLNGNMEVNSNILVGFVDTEGQGNNGDEFDICLFSPILVTSKIVMFWWPGLLQIDTILNSLGAMTNCAKRITRDTQCQRQNKPYGHLHIIFRSWNNNKTPEDVKKKLLEPQSVHKEKDKEHNSIRELLNDCFESIDIWLFPANGLIQCREKLLFEDFNDKWKQTFKNMRKKFSEQLSVNKPKHSAEKTWTGRDIAEFTQLLCKTLTSSENYAITSIFERMQVARAKTLANDALNEFRTLIDKMDPYYKPDGCDYEGIDAYFYKELENFKEKMILEKFSNKIMIEIYANYKESVCLMESEIKTNIRKLTIEVQIFQNKFNNLVSEIMFPLSKSVLKEFCKNQTQQLWNSFNDKVKNFPKKFVHDYRKKLENFCKVKNKHVAAENEKKIISFVQKEVEESLENSVQKLKNRIPMTEEEFEYEWLVLLEQTKIKYLKLHHSFNNFPDYTTFPDNLHIIIDQYLESLTENNDNAWENKAEAFQKRAKRLFKNALYTNFPVNANKVFNNTEIEQYLQEEILRFSYKVSNIFPHTMMNDICSKYKETARLMLTKLQVKNNNNIREIPQKVERYILDWDTFFKEINNTEQHTRGWRFPFQRETSQNVEQQILDWDDKSNELERWQHEVTELLLLSATIPELVTISSFQLLCICNDLTNLNRRTDLLSFRKAVWSIMRSDMKNILSEQFVNEILAGLKSEELKLARMSFINRCLNITTLTFPIRQLFYKMLFVNEPFTFASPIMWRIFLSEYDKYQKERQQNLFFDLFRIPQIVLSLPDLKVINDLLKGDELDSPIVALSCDIIQKTFFAHYELTELHHNFSNAVNSLCTNIVEPLQYISAIAFLKEYVRAFCDVNKTTLNEYIRDTNRTTSEANMSTDMNIIINDINNVMKLKSSRIHSVKIYFLKYLRICNFSMQDIKDLCESQEQPFPWLKEIPWGNKENKPFFNPYWLHQNYKDAEHYYYHVYEHADTCFASYLETVRSNLQSRLFNWANQSNNNRSLKKNDLVTFAGVIAALLHHVRASREWTNNETRVANYLTREIENMDAPSVYKEILNKLILNSNSLIQLLINNEIGPNNNEELLMKSVIVHLIILHASIPNDASPLAAYLHKLQVCENDFILACPSDVEGVVMNAVASFSKEKGAEQGVVRCGEMFVVLDCGGFSNPDEQKRDPTKISISSKCLYCKRVIGYGSIEGDYTRMDTSQIKSVSINHEPGYIVEQISAEKTHNVRMMTPQAYRILHLFVHTLIGASVPSSIATNFFAKNGNSAGDTMKHCLDNIRNDWKILKEFFDCDNDENLALILHSIISSIINESASNEWRLDTPEKREEWEDKFSKDHYISNVTVTAQTIRKKILEDRVSLTEEEIDDMISKKDSKYYSEKLPRLWRKIKDVSLKSLHAYYMINENNETEFPFLKVFFQHEKELHLIKHLLPILKFVHILKTRLDYQITRQEARKMTFDTFIYQESNEGKLQEIFLALKSAFENFEKSWNAVAPHVKRYNCLQFEEFPRISLKSSVMYGLGDNINDFGIYLWAILSYLIRLQNNFLKETISIPFGSCRSLKFLETNAQNMPSTSTTQNVRTSYYLQTVEIQHAQPSNFISYDRNNEILQYSQRNLEISYGEDIVYDLYQIEMKLAHQLIFNKFLISDNFSAFPYYGEMFTRVFTIFTNLKDFIVQEPLPATNIDLLDESYSSKNASRMVPALEMLICSVNYEIDGETSIENYISQQMDLSILTENTDFCGVLRANLRLKHLISLYERVESVKAYNFDKLNAEYKKTLPQYMEKQILNVISFTNSRFLDRIYSCDLLIALERFLDRYLMIEFLEYISTKDKLTSYITNEDLSCWPSRSTLIIAKRLFPHKIQVGQAYSVYKLISSRQASR
ncbi:e3 ubiquitin-protein ligase [Gigaspora margarita]|uniref:E3 ubiquitin-protein ligase n=1 Tax=Gigaspora margarita TaxID=4874 RepID=A0A8H4ERP3_GIGMA|nr:e3 ubiquitin-protein ligase [Gigaspora margarita]